MKCYTYDSVTQNILNLCVHMRLDHLCVSCAGGCDQRLLHCLASVHPLLAAAGSAAPVLTLQQVAQHLEVASLSGVHQHTPT